mgnify:CR=1 FL=1
MKEAGKVQLLCQDLVAKCTAFLILAKTLTTILVLYPERWVQSPNNPLEVAIVIRSRIPDFKKKILSARVPTLNNLGQCGLFGPAARLSAKLGETEDKPYASEDARASISLVDFGAEEETVAVLTLIAPKSGIHCCSIMLDDDAISGCPFVFQF